MEVYHCLSLLSYILYARENAMGTAIRPGCVSYRVKRTAVEAGSYICNVLLERAWMYWHAVFFIGRLSAKGKQGG